MAQGGFIGYGVRVAFSEAASPYVWKKLEQVLDVAIPTEVADKIDTTIHTTGNRLKKNIAGLIGVTDMTVTMLADNDPATSPNQNRLFTLLANGTQVGWRVEIPMSNDPSVDSFQGYEFDGRVLKFEPKAPIGGRQENVATIVFNGNFFDRFDPAASEIG